MGTKLFVGNLSYSITELELREAFSQSGRTVVSVRIAVDRETQRPRGFAFIEVANDADAESAIKEWNGNMLSGRNIFVEKGERFLRQNGAARSGHTYGNDLSLRGRHVRLRIIQSRSGLRASQEGSVAWQIGTLYWSPGPRR